MSNVTDQRTGEITHGIAQRLTSSAHELFPGWGAGGIKTALERALVNGARYALIGGNYDVPTEDSRVNELLEAFGATMNEAPVRNVADIRARSDICSSGAGTYAAQIQKALGDATVVFDDSHKRVAGYIIGTNHPDFKLFVEGSGIRSAGGQVAITVLANRISRD